MYIFCSGYSVVPYPITDQIHLTADDIPDDDDQDDQSKSPNDPNQGKTNQNPLYLQDKIRQNKILNTSKSR